MATTEGDGPTAAVDRLREMTHRRIDARTGQCKGASHAPPQRMFRKDEVNDDCFR